jgi:toxin FitB
VILLDTNVLSALMRDPAEAVVVAWLNGQDPARIWTTAITAFEIRFGLARMAQGRARQALEAAFEGLLREDLAGRVAPLDRAAAEEAGRLAAARQARGPTVDIRDTLVSGIALARRAAVATRNVRHYADLETGVIDPWVAGEGAP